MNKQQILDIVDARLSELGKTSSGASMEAVGNEALISNLRRPRHGLPSLENLDRLAEVLGLELYFGPLRHDPIGDAVRGMFEQNARNSLDEFDLVERVDLDLSAGPGAAADDAKAMAPIAFRKEWLRSMYLSAKDCLVTGVQGDSMQPTLWNGDLVLLDRRPSDQIRYDAIYGLVDIDGDVRVKRIEAVNNGLVLRSDNPNAGVDLRFGEDANRVQILGRVVWSCHRQPISLKKQPKGEISSGEPFKPKWFGQLQSK
jgi:hypothetical protein